MRTTILTEKWIPYRKTCTWRSTIRRSYRSPLRVSADISGETQTPRRPDDLFEFLADARTFVPSDYPYA